MGCGGCWAFSLAEVISDRICIDSGGKDQTIVSETELLTCMPSYKNKIYKGCNGGSRSKGFHYWVSKGLPTKSCKPFPFKKDEKLEDNLQKLECKNLCNDRSKILRDRGTFHKQIYGEKSMMEEIQTNGPITAGFKFYEDFRDFWINGRKGIYEHKYESEEGSHAIKIIGWGTEIINGKEKKYWLCVNSWGTQYDNDDGTFKFLRGENHCGIESSVVTGYKTSKILSSNNEPLISLEGQFFSFNNLKKDFK
jgi:cathepsin B